METIKLFYAEIIKENNIFYVRKKQTLVRERDQKKYRLTEKTEWYKKSGDVFNENKKCYYSTFTEKDNFWYPSLINHIIDCELEINSKSQVVKIKFVDTTEDPFETLYLY